METFFEHLWLTIIPWLIGMVVGGGLGYLIARLLRPLWPTPSPLRSAIIIFPWRTMGIFILLFTVHSPLLFRYFGLGTATALIWLSILSTVIAFGFAVSFFLPSPGTKASIFQPISLARTLVVVMAAAAIIAVNAGAGGAGEIINEGMTRLDQSIFINGILIVVAVSAIHDILLGIIQVFTKPPHHFVK